MSGKKGNHRRVFDELIKQEVVNRIDQGLQGVSSISTELGVSRTTVYNWLNKYSVTYRRQSRIIVEKKSHSNRIKQLEAQLKDLEALVGRKQIRIDYLEKLIELYEAEQGIDLLKKGEGLPWNGLDDIKRSIRGQ